MIFLVIVFFISLSCSVDAGDKKEARRIDKPSAAKVEAVKAELMNEETNGSSDARAIMGLKVEALQWKKKFYEQQSIAMQLKYMIQCWNDTAFQDVQRTGRETDKELKRLLILQ